MTPDLRKSGVDIIGDVPWGMHFCQFYETKRDLVDILVPYFKAGLENNEFCMWVTADPLNVADARRAIRRAMPDFQEYIKKGQIEIIPYSEWYIRDGLFDSDRVLNGWVDKLNAALAHRFAGLRLTGNTFWLEPANWASFTDYEAAVDGVIGNYKMIALCTYSLEKCGAFELLDVVSNHRFALIKRGSHWQTIESTRDKELRQALTKSEERYHILFNGMNEGVALHEIVLDDKGKPIDYRFLEVNTAFEELTGLPAQRVIGKTVKEVLPGIEEPWIKQYGKVALTGEPAVLENYSSPLNKWYEVYAYSPEKGYFITLFMDVTARKKAQEATESLASFPAENPNPIIRVGREGTITYANQASGPILSMWKCQPGAPLPSPYDSYVQEAISTGQVKSGEFDFEGRIYALNFTPVPEKGYVNIYGRDVTERRKTEEALRASEKRYRSFIEVTGELGWTTNAEGEVVEDIPTFRQFTGQSYEEVKGWGWLNALHPDDLERTAQAWREAVAARSAYEIEYRLRRHDGVYRYFLARGVPVFDEGGAVREWIGTCIDITERKKAEEELFRLNRELRAISECNQAIVRASDEQTLLTEVCRVMCEVVDYRMAWVGTVEHDEAKSVRPVAWYGDNNGYLKTANITWADTERGRGPTGLAARTGKTDFCQDFVREPKVALWRDGALARGFRSSIAIPLFDNEGSVFAVLTLYASEPNGFTPPEVRLLEELSGDLAFGIGVLRTRTERRKSEEKLREARDYLDNLLNYANAPIIVWDPSFKITLFNHAFEQLTGLKAAEAVGKQLDILFPVDRREESMGHIRRALAGERWEAVEIPILRMDGQVRTVLWNSATLYGQDGKTPVATIAQGQDITERKRAEEDLQLRTEELARSNAELEQFAYVASHDLQEPLRMVSSYVQLLGARYRGELDTDADDFINYATDGAARMQKLINDLLAYSRVGTRGKAFEIVRLESVLAQSLDNLQVTVKDSGAVITHEPLPAVRGDGGQLTQVFQNLIDNAIKFHANAPPQVHVSAYIQGRECICSVRDNGIGIAPEYTGKLFALFQRLHTRKEYPGTGIGLAVCKRIVERHGGRIWVESKPGEGATFTFTVPAAG